MELRKTTRKKAVVLGLFLILFAFALLQMGFLLPSWGQVFGMGSLLLSSLALLLGLYALIRALVEKQDRLFNGLFFLLLLILGSIFGFWGFYLMIPS